MTVTAILGLIIQASLFTVVLAFGMQATLRDVTFLLRRPGRLLLCLLSINVIMPLLAIVVVRTFDLNHVIEVGLIALAASPIPPILPNKALKSGGDKSFSFGLLVAVSLLSLFVVPGVVKVAAWVFGKQTFFSESAVVQTIFVGIIIPLVLGMVINRLAPGFSERVSGPLGKFAFILLLIAVLPIVIALVPMMWSLIGNFTALAMVSFAIVGLVTGHLLGGSHPNERGVLALATASRHPAIAIALTSANLAETDRPLATAAIMMYFIISTLVAIPYLKWLIATAADRVEEA